ncbi:MAG: hypothetical protein L0Z53_06515 [Acidobacteriales bacterium]|nr:hypothetical protein [Terriglobales bacterium]
MLWVPQMGLGRVEHNVGAVGTATIGTAVTTGAASSTKGADATLIASTAFETYWVRIIATGYAAVATNSRGCLDIWTGTDPEEVIIPNLLFGGCACISGSARIGAKSWEFPLYIPAGTAVGARAAGDRVSTAVHVAIFLFGGDALPPFRVGRKVTTYGITTVPNGTSVTPGASGAEGTFTEIVASTTEDHFAFLPSYQLGGDTTQSNNRLFVDIGAGAATEEEILQSAIFISSGDESCMNLPIWPAFHDVPSGTRLAMRASNSGTNDAAYDGAIHAVS